MQPSTRLVGMCDGCGRPPFVVNDQTIPLKRCSHCHQAWYHNIDCQRRHYKTHKVNCVPLKQRQQDAVPYRIQHFGSAKGYGVVATRAIAKDTVLPMGHPDQLYCHAMVPPVLLTDRRSSHCLICFGQMPVPVQYYFEHSKYKVCVCDHCRPSLHNKHAWIIAELETIHRLLLTLPPPAQLFPTALLVYRILSRPTCDVSTLQCHATDTDKDDEAAHNQATLWLVQQLLAHSSHPSSVCTLTSAPTPKQIQNVLQRIKYNAFTITDHRQQQQSLGIGLYPPPAVRLNHSCRPNVRQTFVLGQPTMPPQLQLTTRIAVLPRQELCLTYMEDVEQQQQQQRRSFLWQHYRFECQCEQCASVEIANLEGIQH